MSTGEANYNILKKLYMCVSIMDEKVVNISSGSCGVAILYCVAGLRWSTICVRTSHLACILFL
jgi:hypothetical protein